MQALRPLVIVIALSGLTGCRPSSSPAESPASSGVRSATSTSDWFEDITKESGLNFSHQLADGKLDNIMESDGAGGVILDYDGDGLMDVYLVNSGPAPVLSNAAPETPRWPNRLFRNRGKGKFEDVTERAGVQGYGFGTTAAAADYDNDGDTDLLVVNFGGLILYQNQGDGTFRDVTTAAGLTSGQAGISATFADVNGDGRLDIFVANYLKYDPAVKSPPGTSVPYPGPLSYEPEFNLLFLGHNDGTFEDVSERSGIRIAGHRGMSVAPLDYDRDGDTDFYVSNDGTANLLLANDGHGRFRDVALAGGVALNQFGEVGGSMGTAVGDADGDGRPDMLVTRFGNASLYINSDHGFFEDRIVASGILSVSSRFVSWGGGFLDFDNDGDLDVLMGTGDPHTLNGTLPLILENLGQARYADASSKAGAVFRRDVNARGVGIFDMDNDGRLDMVVTSMGGASLLLHNRIVSSHHWLALDLRGKRSNRDGFGAWVRLSAGPLRFQAEYRCPTAYVFQHDKRLHFGLGSHPRADRVEIRWPSGQIQTLTALEANRVVLIEEP